MMIIVATTWGTRTTFEPFWKWAVDTHWWVIFTLHRAPGTRQLSATTTAALTLGTKRQGFRCRFPKPNETINQAMQLSQTKPQAFPTSTAYLLKRDQLPVEVSTNPLDATFLACYDTSFKHIL